MLFRGCGGIVGLVMCLLVSYFSIEKGDRVTNSPSSPSEGHDWTGLKLAVQQIPRTGRTSPVVPRTGRTDSDYSERSYFIYYLLTHHFD